MSHYPSAQPASPPAFARALLARISDRLGPISPTNITTTCSNPFLDEHRRTSSLPHIFDSINLQRSKAKVFFQHKAKAFTTPCLPPQMLLLRQLPRAQRLRRRRPVRLKRSTSASSAAARSAEASTEADTRGRVSHHPTLFIATEHELFFYRGAIRGVVDWRGSSSNSWSSTAFSPPSAPLYPTSAVTIITITITINIVAIILRRKLSSRGRRTES